MAAAQRSQSVPQILKKLQNFCFCADLDLTGEKIAISGGSGELETAIFERLLSRFFLESHKRPDSLPLPALLGDGRSIDLFRLYSIVQEKGGFKSVSSISREMGWGSVARELGFESGTGSIMKLVFFKYLENLENWVERISGEGVWESIVFDKDLPRFSGSEVKEGVESNRWEMNGGFSCNKRKRDDLVGLVNWVRMVAKNPCDDSSATLAPANNRKAKPNSSNNLFAQAILVRKAIFLKRIRKNPNESRIKNEDLLESNTSKQIILDTCGNILKVNQTTNSNGLVAVRGEGNDAKQRLRSSSLNFDQMADYLFGDQQRMRVPVRSLFQAKVPAWTGKPCLPCTDSNELKWLGTRTWPTENWESKLLLVEVGRGQSDNCQCVQPGSVECIRFHIAEKRLQLNCELGPAFYSWGFQRLGEEVALSWTEEEERKFKAIVHLYRPSLDKNFWDQLPLCFPLKGRRRLVSYYYNVFLLGRRSYQNRVTPNMIDSDDEESEFGLVSNGFGLAATTVHDSRSFICCQNFQPIELGD